jgi:pyruvate dehydrogenase (quinone)
MPTVAELLVTTVADRGVRTIWGVVGDALNPVTDAIRRDERLEWIGVRHEEAGAFAASAQAQLTGNLAVCTGTVGPGAIHLLNGLYDAKKSRAPVLAICGQVPLNEIGTDFFQEVDNDTLFADVSVYSATISDPAQAPRMIERAIGEAMEHRGVAVLTLPGDVGDLDAPDDVHVHIPERRPHAAADREAVEEAARVLDNSDRVTMLVGIGARDARAEVLEAAELLAAPMVLTLKAKEGFEDDNAYEIGQSGLIGNPATAEAFDRCDTLLMIGTDFPYAEFYPKDATVIQLDIRGDAIGRRTQVAYSLVGDSVLTLRELVPLLQPKQDRSHLDKARSTYLDWCERQQRLTDPAYDSTPRGWLRRKVDNPDRLVRPELLAAAVDRHAARDAVFTSDTGMATVWLSRFVRMRGGRQLLGSYNLGSMANAMPQALGAAALDRTRQVVALCGDGGLSMLLGDLRTAVTYDLPVKLIVFDNGSLGMVKLEQEQAGLPEFGTHLDNPDFAAVARAMGLTGVRVTDPDDVDEAVAAAMRTEGPALVDVVTNPAEVALPPRPTPADAWGFAIAKTREALVSHGD